MSDRVLTEAEHQLICNVLDNEVHRLQALEADGLQPSTPSAQLERLTDMVFAADSIILEAHHG
ncbi:hypothetical protein FEZ32_08850 [Acidipropionibacterium jensenii]|uniref:hypothetical protein n=1 Tax=Acidipropionibacterium jensenii TaxID=1749 RepID=UPI00110A446B|nr:hypothetical protein [Acidipropionibacterium jensenii]QCV88451.1 hypothetical protein FEZ32_08850 [Acidipropionibacterium jensenii]